MSDVKRHPGGAMVHAAGISGAGKDRDQRFGWGREGQRPAVWPGPGDRDQRSGGWGSRRQKQTAVSRSRAYRTHYNILHASNIRPHEVCTSTFIRDHILRDRLPSTAACPACWVMRTKELKQCTVRKKLFCTEPTRAAKQNKNVLHRHDMPNEPTRKDTFHLYS